jgi:hypothetical protein
METYVVELMGQRAYKLLRELEELSFDPFNQKPRANIFFTQKNKYQNEQ